jgi:hypothetical protein
VRPLEEVRREQGKKQIEMLSRPGEDWPLRPARARVS